jgi:hypothetical protein
VSTWYERGGEGGATKSVGCNVFWGAPPPDARATMRAATSACARPRKLCQC